MKFLNSNSENIDPPASYSGIVVVIPLGGVMIRERGQLQYIYLAGQALPVRYLQI